MKSSIYDKVTLEKLSSVIDANQALAESLGMRLCWGFAGRQVRGRIFNGSAVVFEKLYTEKHLHYSMAAMQSDFLNHLERTGQARKRAAYLEQMKVNEENRAQEKEAQQEARWRSRTG